MHKNDLEGENREEKRREKNRIIGENLFSLAGMGLIGVEKERGLAPGFNETIIEFSQQVFSWEQMITLGFFNKLPPEIKAELETVVNGLRAAHAIQDARRVDVIKSVLDVAVRHGQQKRWFDLSVPTGGKFRKLPVCV